MKTFLQKEACFSEREMKLVEVEKPEQVNNSSDCGVFLLTYVEKIFNNLTNFVGKESSAPRHLPDWFTKEEIDRKRLSIKTTIFQLAKEQNPTNFAVFMAKGKATPPQHPQPSSNEVKYKEWLKGLVSAEAHFSRGCMDVLTKDINIEDDAPLSSTESMEVKSIASEVIASEGMESVDMVSEGMASENLESDNMEPDIMETEGQTEIGETDIGKTVVELAYVQSPPPVRNLSDIQSPPPVRNLSDIKRENPWTNRLRNKS